MKLLNSKRRKSNKTSHKTARRLSQDAVGSAMESEVRRSSLKIRNASLTASVRANLIQSQLIILRIRDAATAVAAQTA